MGKPIPKSFDIQDDIRHLEEDNRALQGKLQKAQERINNLEVVTTYRNDDILRRDKELQEKNNLIDDLVLELARIRNNLKEVQKECRLSHGKVRGKIRS